MFAYCLTEPGAGSDASAITTSARREGDEYVTNGTNIFITLLIMLIFTKESHWYKNS